ncbi:unnamed protein product [Fraxinus pennsylvanica]|uniref:Protein FAR1-RELATED SEQUENCE n=1 Tax=Fraxinus pennsylvanica TaxID=56036 RepID=A0AAD2A3L6_9LAMI|nr:unnamed protein product [Fraxinus pennsylvanica]
MEKGEENTSSNRSLFFPENSNYMDTPNVRDGEKTINDHEVLEPTLGDDDDVGGLEPTTENDDDNGGLEPTLENDDDDAVDEPTSRNDNDGVEEPTIGMFFKTEQVLIDYYKQYGRQTGLGIMTQRSRREADAKDVQELPKKYIMDRWRKDIKRRYTLIRSSYDELSSKPAASRYSNLIKLCYQVATNATESEDNSIDMTQKLQAMNEIYMKLKYHATVANTRTSIDAESGSSTKVWSPIVVRGKGQPPSKRKQHPIEKLQTKTKKAWGKRQKIHS